MQKTSQQNKKLSIVKLVIQSLKFEYLLRISQLIHPELFFFKMFLSLEMVTSILLGPSVPRPGWGVSS